MVLDIPVQGLVQLVQQHGVLAVVLGMVIEEVAVPIPSPVVPMAAGALVIKSEALIPAVIEIILKVVIPGSIASVLSSYFVYGIAYIGGKPVLEKYGHFIDVSWREAKRMEEKFAGENEKYYVALFRALPIVPLSLVSGSAGLFRMNWKQYGLWSFIGMLPRNLSLAFIGWYLRDNFLWAANQIDTASTFVLLAVAGAAGAIIAYRNLKDVYRWLLFEKL